MRPFCLPTVCALLPPLQASAKVLLKNRRLPQNTSTSLHGGFSVLCARRPASLCGGPGGAFELFSGEFGEPLSPAAADFSATRPIDWRLRATPEPYTILGGQEMRNYQVSVRACMEELPSPDCEGYILLGARCNLAPLGNCLPNVIICVFHNGRWHLRRGPLVLVAGLLEGFAPPIGIRWRCAVRMTASKRFWTECFWRRYRMESIPSGQVVLGSGYHQVQYEDLRIEPLDDCPYCLRFPAMDPGCRCAVVGAKQGVHPTTICVH